MIRIKDLLHKGLVLIIVACLLSCNNSKTNRGLKSAPATDKGLQLAIKYCSSCHVFPKAEILPTTYWGKVLPIMGFFLGAGKEKFMFADYLNPVAKERLSKSGLFPEAPIIRVEDWIEINKYYLRYSPKQLKVDDTPEFDMNLGQFSVEALPWKSSHEGLSYLNFLDNHFEIGFYTEDASYFIALDKNGSEVEKTKIASPLSDIHKSKKGKLMLLMGKLNNIDEPTGELVLKNDSLQELIFPLERPIDFEVDDFNNDGVEDLLVAEFGKFLGGINIYSFGDTLRKINLHSSSGAVKIIQKDVNNDGLKDFYALVTQADESVYLFLNSGGFTFEKKRLLRLPAHYGTTNFELVDFDGDGDDDIICASGDSGDYGIILKPFHGVRIFENIDEKTYKQIWFFPQQGAYGTASADYDNDGDIDIASIGYFASYLNRDQELFIYFENKSTEDKKWQFEPHGVRGKKDDCWILITNGDIDNDGDLDIILGANSKVLDPKRKTSKLREWQDEGGMVTILKNNLVE